MKTMLLAAMLGLASCGPLVPFVPDQAQLPAGALGGGLDPDVTAVNLAQYAFADASRTYLTRLGTPELDRLGVAWRLSAGGNLERSISAQPLVKAGRVRQIAVTSARRFPPLPDVPSVAEAGFPAFDIASWWGLLAPAGMPKDIVAKLAADVIAVLQMPDVRERLLGRHRLDNHDLQGKGRALREPPAAGTEQGTHRQRHQRIYRRGPRLFRQPRSQIRERHS